MDFADSILDLVGNTPLVRLRRLSEAENLQCTLLAKVETVNPGGSVKDRVAIAMVDAAERDGLLQPGGTIVEPTSGNTGAGLAIVAAQRGYRCIFVMSDKMSDEKVALLRSYGAEVVVCPTAVPPEDPRSYYSTAERLVRETPGAFRPDQYSNAANPLAHEHTTGPEIWRQTRGRVTHFVAGVGTGGTITGVGRALKARNPGVQIVGADPVGLGVLGRHRPAVPRRRGRRGLLADDLRPQRRRPRRGGQRRRLVPRPRGRVTHEEGLLIGGSGGTAVHAALEVARPLGPTPSSSCCCPTPGAATSRRSSTTSGCSTWASSAARASSPATCSPRRARALPDLVLVLPEEQVRDAIAVMHDTGVSQVVVSVTKELPLAAKEVVGTLRELELMDLTFRDDGVLDRPIADIMSPPMPMIGIGEPVARVVSCLEQGPSVLVLDGGHPIGVLTRSDVLSFLAVRTKT